MKNLFHLLFCVGFLACQQPSEAGDAAKASTSEDMPKDTISRQAIGFDHFAIIVDNLGRAADFYQHIVGLQEVHNATGQPHIRWFSLGGDLSLHIIQSEDASLLIRHKSVHLALTVADLPAFMEKLRAAGHDFENWQGVADTTNLRPDKVAQIYFQDPDGYWIEVNDAAAFR